MHTCIHVIVNLPENVGIKFDLMCNECGHISLSKTGLKKSSMTSNRDKSFTKHTFLLATSVEKIFLSWWSKISYESSQKYYSKNVLQEAHNIVISQKM